MARSTAPSRSGCGRLQTFEEGGGPEEVARLDLPPSTPEGFTFAPDGKSLYGTSYYTGVSNVFRFDIATQKYEVLSQRLDRLFPADAAARRAAAGL